MTYMRTVAAAHLLLAVLLAASVGVGATSASKVKLVNNGYEGVVIGISPEVSERDAPALITVLKTMMRNASKHLFQATRRRAFFRQVKVVIPQTWSNTAYDEAATNENFMDSDIRLDYPHPLYKHQMYTEQPGECGEPGEYIHLTPEYLTVDKYSKWFGSPGKTLVTEWARLRWGVFDEVGYPGDPKYPLFYSASSSGASGRVDAASEEYSPNCCSDAPIKGIKRNKRPGGGNTCILGPDNLPDHFCKFYPHHSQNASSSLMSYPFIPSFNIVEFCDSHTHVPFAPTKQNDKCNYRSVWEVMLDHPDFKDGANPPISEEPEEPSITVVKQEAASYAVVMDYSGSMSTNNRIEMLQKTAQRWLLHEAPHNSLVSLIRFSSSPARVLAPLTKLTDNTTRQALANMILTDINGATSIGSGMRAAVQVLAGKSNKNMLLITDGEENESPRINDVIEEVIQARICVITVAFGTNADPNLETLADRTGCKAYTVNDNDQTSMLNDAFQSTLTRQPSIALQFTDILIYESPTKYTTDSSVSDTFTVDSSVGKNLIFRLQTSSKNHVVSPPRLIDPDGSVTSVTEFDDISLVWSVTLPEAKVGTWTWEASLDKDKFNSVKVSITARQRDPNAPPITTRVWVPSPATGVSAVTQNIKIFAEVKQGNNPIIGAVVKAIVTQPDTITAPPDEYLLSDNGVGADSIKNDGIYSGFMTKFSAVGRYNVKAEVTSTGKTVANNGATPSGSSGRRRRRSTSSANYDQGEPEPCCGSVMPLDEANASPTGNFSRVATGGVLKVTEIPAAGTDGISPVKVDDLQVISITMFSESLGANTITLSWTAPGDDLDSGIASAYVVRLSPNFHDLLEGSFDQAPQDTLLPVTVEDLHSANVFRESGSKVNITLKFTRRIAYDQPYYVGLQALDETGNKSKVSNIVMFTVEEKLEMPQWALDKMQKIRMDTASFKNLKTKSIPQTLNE
nr:calcium-activated chloride channel regulator 1-like [Procambarus clarkii]